MHSAGKAIWVAVAVAVDVAVVAAAAVAGGALLMPDSAAYVNLLVVPSS